MTEKNMTVSKDNAVSREATRSGARYLAPPVDIFETEDGLTLVADVPGLDEQRLEINVDQGVLTIEGRRPSAPASCCGANTPWTATGGSSSSPTPSMLPRPGPKFATAC